MTKFFLPFLFVLLFETAFSQDNDIKELTKLNQDWLSSYSTKDKATLATIFADDFVLISPNGTKMTKKDILDNLDKQETVSMKVDSIEVRLVTNDVGIITAYTTFVLKVDGKDVTGHNCYQDVYTKRMGKWRAIAAHVSLLNMK